MTVSSGRRLIDVGRVARGRIKKVMQQILKGVTQFVLGARQKYGGHDDEKIIARSPRIDRFAYGHGLRKRTSVITREANSRSVVVKCR